MAICCCRIKFLGRRFPSQAERAELRSDILEEILFRFIIGDIIFAIITCVE